jgi:proline iminopeptidase
MIRKILKYTGIAIACLLVVLPSSALLYRKYLQHRIAKERAITSSHGIDTLDRAPIGGIGQWIQVRGQDVSNPVLLFIHGGPGIAFIALSGLFQDPWEKYFTVAEWDQRGAGKTYASNDRELQRHTMNVAQMEEDTVEVMNYLRNRFQREKIFVVGHSWGSVLGLWLAHEHPELIYAYVGVGQVISIPENTELMYHDELEAARSRHNQQAVKELENAAENAELKKMSITNKWAGELLGPPPDRTSSNEVNSIVSAVLSAPEYSLADDLGFIRGQRLSLDVFLPQLARIDLNQMGSDFRVPILFFEGRYDPYCRPALIWEYSRRIQAPRKEFVWFEDSGHFPFLVELKKFKDELVRRVLPLVH